MRSSARRILPVEWEMITFSNMVDFKEGPGIRKYQHRASGIPFINIRCIDNGNITRANMHCIDSTEARKSYAHFFLEEGDIVLSSSGTLGKVAQIKPKDIPCLLNTGVIRMRTREKQQLSQAFLLYFLQSPAFQKQIHALARGSVQKNFGPTHLKQMKIYLPPMAMQQEISFLLHAVDEMIEGELAISAAIHTLQQEFFDYFFGPSPATGKKGKLGEFCTLKKGGDWGKDTAGKNLVPVYCLRAVDLGTLYYEGYANPPQRWLRPKSLKNRALNECDIVIAGSGAGACGFPLWMSPAIPALHDLPIMYSNFCKCLRAASPAGALYITQLLMQMWKNGEMKNYITGTSVPNLDIHGLMESKNIVMPAESLLESYANQATLLYAMHYSHQLQLLQMLKQLLLAELFLEPGI